MSRGRIAAALMGTTVLVAGTAFGQAKTNAPERVAGAHTSHVAFRCQDHVLPFVSRTLSFEVAPSR